MNDGNFRNKFWDERYSSEEFIYGTEPNTFLKEQLNKLKPGRLLLLGEGEGRNAVFAARLGWEVDAVDFSVQAKEKALKLAAKNNVTVNYTVQNLEDYTPEKNHYDAVGIIFLHLNEDIREKVHRNAIEALKNDGRILLEVFEKDQLGKKSGGPQSIDMLYSLEDIVVQFDPLEFEQLSKETVMLTEGVHHKGEAVVIRFVGIKA